jgi:hypothetical protein
MPEGERRRLQALFIGMNHEVRSTMGLCRNEPTAVVRRRTRGENSPCIHLASTTYPGIPR